MLCKEVMSVIEESYPRDCALNWDNVGLLAGRDDKEVKRIYVALDADDDVVETAVRIHADIQWDEEDNQRRFYRTPAAWTDSE